MNTLKSIPLLFLTLFLLAASSWFYLAYSPSIRLKKIENIPGHHISSLHLAQFSTSGELDYQLDAPIAYHVPKDEVYIVQEPHAKLQKTNQPDVTIDAHTARIAEKGESIELKEDVVITHGAYKQYAKGVIKTHALSYFPQRKYASTEENITWHQARNQIKSTGATLDLITEKLELLHQVTGVYYAQNKTTFKADKAIAHTNEAHQPSEVELIGHAEITQGKNHIKAPFMRYNLKNETFYTQSDTHDKIKPTRILIDVNSLPAITPHG